MVKRDSKPRRTLWFGTRTYMEAIPEPRIDTDASGVGFSTGAQYIDGQAFIRRSRASHRVYNFSWNLTGREYMQKVFDFAAGVFGAPPYYFIDPFAADQNIMPEWWAAPGMATDDAPILFGEEAPQRLTNTDFSQRYPAIGALYNVNNVEETYEKLWLPIPPGQTLWIGAHGPSNSTTGGYVKVTPYLTPTMAGGPVSLQNIPLNSLVRCDQNFRSDEGYVGVEISLGGLGTVSLFGIIAQMLPSVPIPSGVTNYDYGEPNYGDGLYGGNNNATEVHPYPGAFIGGQGHVGVEFQDHPTRQNYAVNLDAVGSSAVLVEVLEVD